jgi:hypothetical protein
MTTADGDPMRPEFVGDGAAPRAHAVSVDRAIKPALQPNPLLGFLMQAAALGAFLGTLVAYWRRRNDDEFDAFPIVTRWSVVIFLLGAGYAVFEAIT